MRKIVFIVLVLTQIQFCFAEKIGLCLSGGGAKGAYEMGVWQALDEYGLKSNITAISGTSVGGLNAVLFSTMPTTAKAKSIWQDKIFFTTILTPDSAKNAILSAEASRLKQFVSDDETTLKEKLKMAGSYLLDKAALYAGSEKAYGLFKRDEFERLIDREIPLSKIKQANSGVPDIFISAVEKQNGGKLHVFKLQDQPQSRITPILLATSAIPFAFDSVTLDNVVNTKGQRINYGTEFFDGGTDFLNGDNTNIEPLLNSKEVETIFVVFLNDRSRMKKSSIHIQEENKLKEIYNAKVNAIKEKRNANVRNAEAKKKAEKSQFDNAIDSKKQAIKAEKKSTNNKTRIASLESEIKSLRERRKQNGNEWDNEIKDIKTTHDNEIKRIPRPETTNEWSILERRYLTDHRFERQDILDLESRAKNFGKDIVFFIPSQDLGNLLTGTLNFGDGKMEKLIELGYNDAVKVLRENGITKKSGNSFFDAFNSFRNDDDRYYYDDDDDRYVY